MPKALVAPPEPLQAQQNSIYTGAIKEHFAQMSRVNRLLFDWKRIKEAT
jgi:hypothetical protein